MELVCKVQNYHWGKVGTKSLVAKLAHENSGVEIKEDKTYAELWIGIHPNGPSHVKSNGIPLAEHMQEHPDELGEKVIQLFGTKLPFLFKVLSIEEALSIQAHPAKQHAEELFKEFPALYKDDNHKPELAIALTQFEALCGFRPQSEIKFFLQNVPEFSILVEKEKIQKFLAADENDKEALKDCFLSLMYSADTNVKVVSEKLLKRLSALDEPDSALYLVDLIKRIHEQYPGDIGIFCIYWLNYLVLQPGQALYLAPNEPHAYLSGDCVECMANSDNVVRAGLTPKHRDVRTLCSMLTYNSYQANEICFSPVIEDDFCQVFYPPVQEFAVAKIELQKKTSYTLKVRETASVILLTEGHGKVNSEVLVKTGSILYVPAGEKCQIESYDKTVLFQAFCNI